MPSGRTDPAYRCGQNISLILLICASASSCLPSIGNCKSCLRDKGAGPHSGRVVQHGGRSSYLQTKQHHLSALLSWCGTASCKTLDACTYAYHMAQKTTVRYSKTSVRKLDPADENRITEPRYDPEKSTFLRPYFGLPLGSVHWITTCMWHRAMQVRARMDVN